MLRKLFAIQLFLFFGSKLFGQGTCASPYNLGTIGTTSVCVNLSNGTTGSAPCAGAGYGGSGGVTYVRFCTGASTTCINFSINQGSASGNWAVTVYSANCSTAMDAQCLGNSGTGATFNTASPSYNGYQPNSCYIARIWSGNAGSFNLCAQAMAPPNNYCTNPTQISTTTQFFNNFCMTAGSNGSYTEPTPAQFCAGSLENNAWYSFTTASTCIAPCTVTININGITCSGGGAGFQIGFWTGACGSLTNIGCTSGSGGNVTATINNLSPNQTVIVGLDGNAGANCTYSMSATNTVPLPIEMMAFDVFKYPYYVDIKWSTMTEKNNGLFTIEKSPDAVNFTEVGSVAGADNSREVIHYTYKDYKPSYGVSYYRIKQTDNNGNYTYSQMRAIDYSFDTNPGFDVIPNPSSEESAASIMLYDVSGKQTEVILMDITGKEIYSVKNVNSGRVDLPLLGRGVYFVKVTGIEFQVTKKLIVR